MEQDKQIELIGDVKTDELSECCNASVGAGRCWACREAVINK